MPVTTIDRQHFGTQFGVDSAPGCPGPHCLLRHENLSRLYQARIGLDPSPAQECGNIEVLAVAFLGVKIGRFRKDAMVWTGRNHRRLLLQDCLELESAMTVRLRC